MERAARIAARAALAGKTGGGPARDADVARSMRSPRIPDALPRSGASIPPGAAVVSRASMRGNSGMAYFFFDRVMRQEIAEIVLRRAWEPAPQNAS